MFLRVTSRVLNTHGAFGFRQAKQIQIDDMFSKFDDSSAALERLRDEKDQEIAILQEGMDSTIQQLSDAQQAGYLTYSQLLVVLPVCRRKA
jgi:hypothetical protein